MIVDSTSSSTETDELITAVEAHLTRHYRQMAAADRLAERIRRQRVRQAHPPEPAVWPYVVLGGGLMLLAVVLIYSI